MTRYKVDLSELMLAAKKAHEIILSTLQSREKELLISIYEEKPKWDNLPFTHIKELPAIKWKLLNISKMTARKRDKSIRLLKKVLDVRS